MILLALATNNGLINVRAFSMLNVPAVFEASFFRTISFDSSRTCYPALTSHAYGITRDMLG